MCSANKCKALAGTACRSNHDCKSAKCISGICESEPDDGSFPDGEFGGGQDAGGDENSDGGFMRRFLADDSLPSSGDYAGGDERAVDAVDTFSDRMIPSPQQEPRFTNALFDGADDILGLTDIEVVDFADYGCSSGSEIYVVGKAVSGGNRQVQFIYNKAKNVTIPLMYNIELDQIEHIGGNFYGLADGDLYKWVKPELPAGSLPSTVHWDKMKVPFASDIVHIASPQNNEDLWVQTRYVGYFLSNQTELEEVITGRYMQFGKDKSDFIFSKSQSLPSKMYTRGRGWLDNESAVKCKMVNGREVILKGAPARS
jgi:hypothetical protein